MRKLLFIAAATMIVVASIEFAAAVGWRVQSGNWQSLASISELRRGLIGSDDRVSDAPARRRALMLQRNFNQVAVHPYLGYVVDPDQRKAKRNNPAADLGFPASRADPLTTSDDTTAVVLVTGGSVALLFGARSDALETSLARLPQLAGREIKVATIANGGYKQPQQLMALNYVLLLGATPDLVINIDGFNEIALPPVDLTPYGINPLYPRVWAYQMAEFDPTLRSTLGRVSYIATLRGRNAERFSGALSYSFVAGLLWKALDRRLESDQEAAEAVLRQKRLALEGYQVKGPSAPSDPAEQERFIVDSWSRASLLMQQLCRARGIGYFHFLQPNQYVTGSKPLSQTELSEALNDKSPYRSSVDSGYTHLRAAGRDLRRQGVEFHDLTDLFQDVEETLYIDDCCHFSVDGDRILADTIAGTVGASWKPDQTSDQTSDSTGGSSN